MTAEGERVKLSFAKAVDVDRQSKCGRCHRPLTKGHDCKVVWVRVRGYR